MLIPLNAIKDQKATKFKDSKTGEIVKIKELSEINHFGFQVKVGKNGKKRFVSRRRGRNDKEANSI